MLIETLQVLGLSFVIAIPLVILLIWLPGYFPVLSAYHLSAGLVGGVTGACAVLIKNFIQRRRRP